MTQGFKLIWTIPNLYDRLVSGAIERVRAAFGLRGQTQTALELHPNQAWRTEFSAPVSNNRDMKAALTQALPALCPFPPEQATIYAAASDTASKVDLLFLKTDVHNQLIGEVDGTHAFAQDGMTFKLEKSLRKDRLVPGAIIGATLASLLILNFGLSSLVSQSMDANTSLRTQEATLRAELKTRSDAARQKSTLDVFLATNPAQRLPQARLNMLARYSEATPDSAYWLDVSVDAAQTTITGSAEDASAAIAEITEALPNERVSTAGSITADTAGRERFVITITTDTRGPTQ
jgi:hypothetical protein